MHVRWQQWLEMGDVLQGGSFQLATLDPNQLNELARNAEEHDVVELCDYLRERYPGIEGDLRASVKNAVAIAKQHALFSKADVYTFVCIKVVYGAAVERTPEFVGVASDPAVDPGARMAELAQRTKPAFWREHYSPAPGAVLPQPDDGWE